MLQAASYKLVAIPTINHIPLPEIEPCSSALQAKHHCMALFQGIITIKKITPPSAFARRMLTGVSINKDV